MVLITECNLRKVVDVGSAYGATFAQHARDGLVGAAERSIGVRGAGVGPRSTSGLVAGVGCATELPQ